MVCVTLHLFILSCNVMHEVITCKNSSLVLHEGCDMNCLTISPSRIMRKKNPNYAQILWKLCA